MKCERDSPCSKTARRLWDLNDASESKACERTVILFIVFYLSTSLRNPTFANRQVHYNLMPYNYALLFMLLAHFIFDFIFTAVSPV